MKKATRRISDAPIEVGLKTSESLPHDPVTVDFGDGHATNVDEGVEDFIADAEQEHNQDHEDAGITYFNEIEKQVGKILATVKKLRLTARKR